MNVVHSWYVRLNDWNVLHVPRVLMYAPSKDGGKIATNDGSGEGEIE